MIEQTAATKAVIRIFCSTLDRNGYKYAVCTKRRAQAAIRASRSDGNQHQHQVAYWEHGVLFIKWVENVNN